MPNFSEYSKVVFKKVQDNFPQNRRLVSAKNKFTNVWSVCGTSILVKRTNQHSNSIFIKKQKISTFFVH